MGVAAAVVLSAGAAAAHAGEAYVVTVNQATSEVRYNVTTSAPFAGTLVGENDPLKPAAERTRTKRPASFFSCGSFGATQNDAINISGSLTASGNNTTGAPARPSGTFQLEIDTTSNVARVRRANLQLLASGSISVSASLSSFTYQAFCAINPSCNAPFITPITLPIGSIGVSSITVVQAPADIAVGTITPAGTNQWTYNVPATVNVGVAANFQGGPVNVDPQTIPIVLTGTITRTGSGLTATLSTVTTTTIAPGSQTNTVPTVLPPSPITVPADSILCPNANLITALTINSTTANLSSTATLNSGGPRVPCVCDADGNGLIEVPDIFVFLDQWFAGNPSADFNSSGATDVPDIFSFLGCWFSSTGFFGC